MNRALPCLAAAVLAAGGLFAEERDLTVAFLGGSITEMDGYRPLLMRKLAARFPDTKFSFIDAGLGSTCSTAGAFRFDEDVLAKGIPDVLFVEFAVNDDQDAHHSHGECVRGMEGVIRHARRINPRMDIVMVLFANKGEFDAVAAGKDPIPYVAHKAVAERYGVPVVNVGEELVRQTRQGTFSWERYRDCHPSPEGNALVADLVEAKTKAAFGKRLGRGSPRALPGKLDANCYDQGLFLQWAQVQPDDGWTLGPCDWGTSGKVPRPYFKDLVTLWSSKPGATFSFRFTGKACGAFVTAGPDAGILEFSIDGGDWGKVDLFHAFSPALHYPRVVLFAEGLADRLHDVRVRLSEKRNARSTGTFARIHRLCVDTKYRLPEKMLGGYTGIGLGVERDVRHVERMIDRMGRTGFNAFDCKYQHYSNRRVCDLDANIADVIEPARKARAAGLTFQVYLYPIPWTGLRHPDWEEHANIPCVVNEKGVKAEKNFLLTEASAWKQLFSHAYQFARRHDEIHYATLKFDIETIPFVTSYDDANWRTFAKTHPDFPADTPAGERYALLKRRGAVDAYRICFRESMLVAVREFMADLRTCDPNLICGYMPASEDDFRAYVFNRALSTPRLGLVADGWELYNGSGYQDFVAEHAERFRRVNPDIRFVCWTRPCAYLPKDTAATVYQTVMHTDGFSQWALGMLDAELKDKGIHIPKGTTEKEYWDAYAVANAAVRKDLVEGTQTSASRLPRIKIKPTVAELDWSGDTVPKLRKAGNGAGADRDLVLRERSLVFVYAETGEEMRFTLRHMAGHQRAVGVQYAIFDADKRVLRNEYVEPGAESTFAVVAPQGGVYALAIDGAEAWYSVRVHKLHYALDCRHAGTKRYMQYGAPGTKSNCYLFRSQTFYVCGSDHGNPTLGLQMSDGEGYTRRINDGEPVTVLRKADSECPLPEGIVKLSYQQEDTIRNAQNYRFWFPNGRNPFIYGSPERRLEVVEEKK